MIRTVSRAVAGVAAAALAMSLGIASASAADATIVIKAKSGSQVLGFTPGVITVTTSVPGKVDFFADTVDEGLYFIGEAVDVTGWLGGYNFQWAWSSGWAAGQVC